MRSKKEQRKSEKKAALYGISVSGLNPIQVWIFFFFFSGFLLATAKVASITAMIFVHVTLHPTVLICEFSYIHNFSAYTVVSTLTKLRPVELQNKLFTMAF